MTSFSRKLYNRDPAAAEAFHQSQQFDHRIVYGKQTTLACFMNVAAPVAATSFGKRLMPPTLPAYECWAPSRPSAEKAIVRASDGFQARKEYAEHHHLHVSEVTVRLMDNRAIEERRQDRANRWGM